MKIKDRYSKDPKAVWVKADKKWVTVGGNEPIKRSAKRGGYTSLPLATDADLAKIKKQGLVQLFEEDVTPSSTKGATRTK